MVTFFNIKKGDPAFEGLTIGIHDSISIYKIRSWARDWGNY